MTLPWVEKYKPKTSVEVPQKKGLNELKEFLLNFDRQKRRAALLHGPTGTCKTCAVHLLGKELGFEVLEVNASDFRNRDQIEERVGNALKQRSLFFDKKLLLVDEIDGLSGRDDRGGVQALAGMLDNNAFPVVMTATDLWNESISKLKAKSVLIEFGAVDVSEIHKILEGVARSEGISADSDTLRTVARRSGGDLRVALNDLQTLGQQSKKITGEMLAQLGTRDRTETIMQALTKILKGTDPKLALEAFGLVDEDIEECFLWLDENIPKEYTLPADLARAYDALSRADVFLGRIRRWQHWHYLVYANALLTAGVSAAKDEKYRHFAQYARTMRLLKIWQANNKYALRKSIAQKLAAKTHSSLKKVLQNTMPYVKHVCECDKKLAEKLAVELNLDCEELDWLTC